MATDHTLTAEGLRKRYGDVHALDGFDLSVAPGTIHGLLTSLIDRLTPQQQLTLKVASVLGRAFPFELLRAVHPVEADRPTLPQQLAELERLDLPADWPAASVLRPCCRALAGSFAEEAVQSRLLTDVLRPDLGLHRLRRTAIADFGGRTERWPDLDDQHRRPQEAFTVQPIMAFAIR